MTRQFFIFLGTFVAGALIALAARATWFDSNAGHSGHPAAGGDYAPMVSNSSATTPAAASATTTKVAQAPNGNHGNHAAMAANPPPAGSATPVNTVCSICGMEVDPDLPTATYQGKAIGFGCKACPAQFAANPDRYGPAALRNEVVKR